MVFVVPSIDLSRISLIAKVFKNMDIKPMNLFDSRFYPDKNEPIDKVFMYFLVMVSMDHRISRPGKIYKGVVNGEEFQGADLLYRLGMEMYNKYSDFFTPNVLARISSRDVESWLFVGDVGPSDCYLRTLLLQDLGVKIIKLFDGDSLEILRISGNWLKKNDGSGLIDVLKIFKAYQDPVEKKGMLLAKFLSYRNIINIVDLENKRVAVDNHLTRIAIRLGLIDLEKNYVEKILNRVSIDRDEDIVIRYVVREAYRYLAIYSNVDVFHLDDFLWNFGRTICMKNKPMCNACCFRNMCKAYEENIYLEEPVFFNTWYY